MTLAELKTGMSATIDKVEGKGALRRHFLDMGLIPGTRVKLVKVAPMGDPMELRIRGYELTIRNEDAQKIHIINQGNDENKEPEILENPKTEHPGIGEMGAYHVRRRGCEIRDGE